MVTKNEKLAAAEECLKELASYLSSSEEVNVETFSQEKRERFYVLASKYSSFKQDPQLKGFLSSLEDKYQIPAGFRTRVEEYAKRREEVLESAKKADYVDREQQKIEEREDQEYRETLEDTKRILSYDELRELAKSVGVQVEEAIRLQADLKKADDVLVNIAKRGSKELEFVSMYMAETMSSKDIERVLGKLPKSLQSKAKKMVEDHKRAIDNDDSKRVFRKKGNQLEYKGGLPDGGLPQYVDDFNLHFNKQLKFSKKRSMVEKNLSQFIYNVENGNFSPGQQQQIWTDLNANGKVNVDELGEELGLPKEVIYGLKKVARGLKGPNDRVNGGSGGKPYKKNAKLEDAPDGKDADSTRENEESGKKPHKKNADSTRENGGSGEMPEDALVNTKADVDVAKVVKAAADANITQEEAGTAHQSITQNAYEIG
ncbi:MAG: hypothetical protein IJY92_05950 [Alphaproteobacteria bacterium]|nr:hypothetical protein [Alphaproteobacteria bacterium]